MNNNLRDSIHRITKGDTRLAESFFRRPSGRRYLENLSLILIHTLAPHSLEKEGMYLGFLEVLDGMEDRIARQKDGEAIIESAIN